MERILPDKSKLCRLCLTESVVYHSLLEEDRAIFLETLTSIKIEDEEALPTNACVRCCLSLKYAFQIQQNILEADRKLRLFDYNLVDKEEDQKPTELNAERGIAQDDSMETDMQFFQIEPPKQLGNVEIIDLPIFEQVQFDKGPVIENVNESDVVLIKHEVEYSRECTSGLLEDTSLDSTGINSISIGSIGIDSTGIDSHSVEGTGINSTDIDDIAIDTGVESSCKICGLTFPEKELMEHIKFHYFSNVKCDECNMPCENIHTYRMHLMLEHKDVPTDKNWVCKVCQISFLYKPLYIIHFRSAHPVKAKSCEDQSPGAYPCSYCKKKFFNEKRRDAHSAVHKKKQCDICGVYITPTNFPAHRKSHLEQEVECPICGRKYKNTVSLKGHIHYTHSQRTYMCEFCDKTFKKSYSLLLHIKREHTGEKSHVCDLCGKSFLTFYNLSKHKKMTHQKLRPFQCEYCQKKFSSKFALRTHERQHTLDAPFECDLCSQSFRQKVSLKSHKKSVHNVVEPLTCACEVCGKRFSSKFAVMSHMRLH